MKITKVYTRTGDKGMTSLVGGIRIDKSATRLDAYGTIDELSSHIGLLIAYIEQDINDAHILEVLGRVHNTLFNVGSYLATDASLFEEKPEWLDGHINGILSQLPAETELLEQEIDAIQPTLPTGEGGGRGRYSHENLQSLHPYRRQGNDLPCRRHKN